MKERIADLPSDVRDEMHLPRTVRLVHELQTAGVEVREYRV
jgi:hypothetical protein